MPSQTSRWALPYPLGSDPDNVPGDIANLAQRLDSIMPTDAQGLLGSRPAPGNEGALYFATDTGIYYRDNGTQWVALNLLPTVGGPPHLSNPGDVAAPGSSTTAAAADHTHAREPWAGTGGNYGQAAAVARGDHAHTKTLVMPHTWVQEGAIAVPAGAIGFIGPMFAAAPAGQTVTIVGVDAWIRSAGTVTFNLQQNGVTVTGLAGCSATNSRSFTPATGTVTVADHDMLAPVVTAVAGNPDSLTVSLRLAYTTTS